MIFSENYDQLAHSYKEKAMVDVDSQLDISIRCGYKLAIHILTLFKVKPFRFTFNFATQDCLNLEQVLCLAV